MTGLRDRLSIRRKVKMSDEQREKRQGIMDENGGCIEHIGKETSARSLGGPLESPTI
jgi:hypothetical protein